MPLTRSLARPPLAPSPLARPPPRSLAGSLARTLARSLARSLALSPSRPSLVPRSLARPWPSPDVKRDLWRGNAPRCNFNYAVNRTSHLIHYTSYLTIKQIPKSNKYKTSTELIYTLNREGFLLSYLTPLTGKDGGGWQAAVT